MRPSRRFARERADDPVIAAIDQRASEALGADALRELLERRRSGEH
jgi:hypothetical protein